MKFILCAALELIMVGSLSVSNGDRFEGKASAAQANSIIIRCPHQIQVGPVSPPAGWQSLGSIPRNRFQIVLDTKNQMVVCWYGDVNTPFVSALISQKFPEGYDCKTPYPMDYQAVCTKKTRRRTDD